MKKIFFSHSSLDNEIVKALVLSLKDEGINDEKCFIDFKDIHGGDNIVDSIRENLISSDISVLIITKSFLASRWTKAERDISIKQQIDGTRKKIIGLIYEDVTLDDPFLEVIQLLDFKTVQKQKANLQFLVKELNIVLNQKHKININSESELFDYFEYTFLSNKFTFEKINIQDLDNYSSIFKEITEFGGDIREYSKKNIYPNLFELIENFISFTKEEIPLSIEGDPGTGKSTFLVLLYSSIKQSYNIGSQEFLPIYIDIEIYNNRNEDKALAHFIDDFQPIVDFLNRNDIKPILIIDGIDDYFKSVLKLNSHILKHIEAVVGKKVILGLSKTDNFPESRKQLHYNTLSSLRIKDLSNHKTDFSYFINVFTNLYNVNRCNPDKDKRLREFINELNPSRLDFFILLLFYRNLPASRAKISSIAHLYNIVAEQTLKNKDEDLARTSMNAFNFYIHGKRDETFIRMHFNAWNLIHSHISFRDFFIANHIINSIVSYGKTKRGELLLVFGNVYPSPINSFCKEIMNRSYKSENMVLNGIKSAFDSVDLTGKTHFCYLLGRFQQNYTIAEAKKLLRNQLEKQMEPRMLSRADDVNQQQQRYVRTIYISLAYLGDSKASDEYVDLILFNKEYDQVNRGFHLEYYGDLNYEISDHNSLTSKDDSNYSIEKTFHRLSNRIKSSLKANEPHKLFNIELHTICSLIQHRHLVLKNTYLVEIRELSKLISEILIKTKFCRHKNLTKYLRFLSETLKNDSISTELDLFKPIYRIKEIKRSGWTRKDKNRNVEFPETVASHMYGCLLIAKFYLHERLPLDEKDSHPNYSKSKILEILMFHDLGEYLKGDISSDLKTKKDHDAEEQAIEQISMLSSYESFGFLKGIEENWRNFENDLDDDDKINFNIARDIDKIENILQLLIYYFEKNAIIPDFENFFISVFDKIRTNIGNNIVTRIYKPYYQELIKFPEISNRINTFIDTENSEW